MALFISKYFFFLLEVEDEEEDQCWIYDGKKLFDKAGLWAPIEVTLLFEENQGRGVTTEETGETTISPEFSDETTVSPNFSDMLTLSQSEGVVIIKNVVNNMVLSVNDVEKINWLEAFGVNNTNQTWIVGVPFSQKLQEEECFTLQNQDSGLFLTAIGPNELEIQGTYLEFGSNQNFSSREYHSITLSNTKIQFKHKLNLRRMNLCMYKILLEIAILLS